jgi:hypothetical protein
LAFGDSSIGENFVQRHQATLVSACPAFEAETGDDMVAAIVGAAADADGIGASGDLYRTQTFLQGLGKGGRLTQS